MVAYRKQRNHSPSTNFAVVTCNCTVDTAPSSSKDPHYCEFPHMLERAEHLLSLCALANDEQNPVLAALCVACGALRRICSDLRPHLQHMSAFVRDLKKNNTTIRDWLPRLVKYVRTTFAGIDPAALADLRRFETEEILQETLYRLFHAEKSAILLFHDAERQCWYRENEASLVRQIVQLATSRESDAQAFVAIRQTAHQATSDFEESNDSWCEMKRSTQDHNVFVDACESANRMLDDARKKAERESREEQCLRRRLEFGVGVFGAVLPPYAPFVVYDFSTSSESDSRDDGDIATNDNAAPAVAVGDSDNEDFDDATANVCAEAFHFTRLSMCVYCDPVITRAFQRLRVRAHYGFNRVHVE
jgi:hypothetical protein